MDPTKAITNLSSRPLSQNKQEVLSLSLNFATVPKRILYNAIIVATEATCKQLRCGEANLLRKEINNALNGAKPPKQNIEKRLRCVITDLCKDDSITIHHLPS